MQRFDYRPGSDLVWCTKCGRQFTRTQYRAHAHNANQARCGDSKCSNPAVGYLLGADSTNYGPRGSALLCGEHLLERWRGNWRIHIVDGSQCRQCEGYGKIQTNTQRFGETSNQWIRCPNCQGTGYDSDPRPSVPARPAQRAAPPRVGPTVAEVLRNTELQPRPQPSTPEEPEQREPEQQPAPPTPQNSRQWSRPRILTNSKRQKSRPRRPAKRNSPQRRRPRILTNSRSQYSRPRRRAKRNSREGKRVRHLANPGHPLGKPLLRQGNCGTQNGVRRRVHPGSSLGHRSMVLPAVEVSAELWFGLY